VKGLRNLTTGSRTKGRYTQLYDLAESLNDLGFVYINTGLMREAQHAFQETLDIHVKIRSNLGALASARNNIAYLHHQVGHYADAWHEYTLALEHAKSANQVRVLIGILNGRGELLLDVGEQQEALKTFQQALAIVQQHGERPESVGTFTGLARTERLRGNYNEAMNWLRKASTFSGTSLDEIDYLVEMGSIYSEMGQIELALKQYNKSFATWKQDQPLKQGQVLAAFYIAAIYFKKKRTADARELVKRALEGAARLGYDQFLVVAARSAPDLIQKLGTLGSSGQIRALLERSAKFTSGKAALELKHADEQIRPMHLAVSAFGLGEIRLNGELLPANAWRSSRARALFFYILDRGKVRKETIGLDFWPDFSSGKISSNFHATLWRVRQALGFRDAIVFENDHYSLHPSIQIWYDVREFESNLAKAAVERTPPREHSELIRQAVDLYSDSYLQDIYMEWTDRRREQLRSLYVDALISLAVAENNNKRYREARAFYEKILAVEPYRDEIHLALMKCIALSGAPSVAIAHFNEYRALLRRELNAEPLQELRDYYDQLAIKVQN
jgi:DNA-binding SARP family transcriptional activator